MYKISKYNVIFEDGDYVVLTEVLGNIFHSLILSKNKIVPLDLLYEFLEHPNIVTAKEIKKAQESFIFRCDFFELKNLIDIKPKEGSAYIRSVCEPFDEEMEIDLKKVENWLDHFNLLPYYQIHASGHAPGDEIMSTITNINPDMVFPIHTEHPYLFYKMLHHRTSVVLPELEKKYNI